MMQAKVVCQLFFFVARMDTSVEATSVGPTPGSKTSMRSALAIVVGERADHGRLRLCVGADSASRHTTRPRHSNDVLEALEAEFQEERHSGQSPPPPGGRWFRNFRVADTVVDIFVLTLREPLAPCSVGGGLVVRRSALAHFSGQHLRTSRVAWNHPFALIETACGATPMGGGKLGEA